MRKITQIQNYYKTTSGIVYPIENEIVLDEWYEKISEKELPIFLDTENYFNYLIEKWNVVLPKNLSHAAVSHPNPPSVYGDGKNGFYNPLTVDTSTVSESKSESENSKLLLTNSPF